MQHENLFRAPNSNFLILRLYRLFNFLRFANIVLSINLNFVLCVALIPSQDIRTTTITKQSQHNHKTIATQQIRSWIE